MSQGIHPRVRSAVMMMTLLVLPLLGGILLLPTTAMAGTTPAGQWIGEVKTPDGDKVQIKLNLEKSDSGWAGSLEDPTMGETTVSNLRVTGTRISFTFKPTNAPFDLNFSGSYVAGDDRVTGTFSLHGTSRFVKFKRVPGSEVDAMATTEEPKEPARIRHDYRFGITARVNYWAALHVVQAETYTLNDITSGAAGFDGTFKFFVMDGFNIFFRYYRGGLGYTDDPLRLEEFAGLNISADSYLALDGMEFGIMGYLGNTIMPNSNFNPYLTATIGQVSWTLHENERGSAVAKEGLYFLEGEDIAVAFGIGTEYELSQNIALEFEWLWRFFMTEDDTRWPETETLWSNTHAWGLSAGLTFGF